MKLVSVLRLLGDETRLRILYLLSKSALNVSELTGILGLAQSGVSRHLSQLKSAGLLQERKEGLWNYYQLCPAEEHDDELQLLLSYMQQQLHAWEDPFRDEIRLNEILMQRDESGTGLNERLLEPGQSWLSWSRALSYLTPSYDIIDLGCGDGSLTLEMCRFARSVIGIDYNPKLIELAKKKVSQHGLKNIQFVVESIETLSVQNDSVDIAFLCQSLHHFPEPIKGIQQAYRVLRPGGRIMIMELASHEESWVQEKLGHQSLGFSVEDITQMLTETHFEGLQIEQFTQAHSETFKVILSTATKPRHAITP